MEINADTLLTGLLWFLVFCFSTTCHEAAHAWAALRLGDSTAYQAGQVSLSPLPHIRREPFGMVFMPILSFLLSGWMLGWASAPYDPIWSHTYPRRSAWMSLAGPAANFVLMLFAGLVIRLLYTAGLATLQPSHSLAHLIVANGALAASGFGTGLMAILSNLFTLNLLPFVSNLLPVPPLDGSGAVMLLMPESAARRYQEVLFTQPFLAMAGLVLAWKFGGPLLTRALLLGITLLFA